MAAGAFVGIVKCGLWGRRRAGAAVPAAAAPCPAARRARAGRARAAAAGAAAEAAAAAAGQRVRKKGARGLAPGRAPPRAGQQGKRVQKRLVMVGMAGKEAAGGWRAMAQTGRLVAQGRRAARRRPRSCRPAARGARAAGPRACEAAGSAVRERALFCGTVLHYCTVQRGVSGAGWLSARGAGQNCYAYGRKGGGPMRSPWDLRRHGSRPRPPWTWGGDAEARRSKRARARAIARGAWVAFRARVHVFQCT